MLVAILLAAVVILGGVIVVARGKGGELSREWPDLPTYTDFRSWSEVADYRPPAALLGYHAGATEGALALIAQTIAERDAEIDWLRRRLAELQQERVASAQAGPAGASAATTVAEPIGASAAPPPDAELAAEASWQGGRAAGSGVASGFSGHQPVSQSFGEDE